MSVRDDILAAGVNLLRERGIAALTQPQVSAAAGVKQSHLTYYFPTRGDLLLGIAEHSIDGLMAGLAARLAQTQAPGSLGALLAEVIVSGVPPRVMIGLIVAADAEPSIRDRLRELVPAIRARIATLLRRAGMPAGKDDVLLFHATVVGLAIMHQAQLNETSAEEVRRGVAALLKRAGKEK